MATSTVRGAQMVLPGAPFAETVDFFTQRLGFRVDAIFPADAPSVAVLSGHGLTVRLEPSAEGTASSTIRLMCDDPLALGGGARELVAPNGTLVRLIDAAPQLAVPPESPSLVVTHLDERSGWGTGRAGMQYRDVIPGRQGGRFIASHIRIPGGGPVPDYVHYHKVRFQMIYCYKGWVRLVYEDQGEPFVMEAGDCVLQPPEIRHRVLESGDGLEVIEIGCPAEHETLAEHEIGLPTGRVLPDRDFGGQRFVRHDASKATWHSWRVPGFAARDLGIGAATDGLAGARVVRPAGFGATQPVLRTHDAELVFTFVLRGGVAFEHGAGPGVDEPARHELGAGDTVVVPAGMASRFVDWTTDLELLDVTLPDRVALEPA
ncbi:MAG: cupin domain-containing protein [Ilumatobacteraceae bacterium]